MSTDQGGQPHVHFEEFPANIGYYVDREDRPSRDQSNMAIARVLAERGTCSRAQVGALITRGNRIVSTGYNGAPAGRPHCYHPVDHFPATPQLADIDWDSLPKNQHRVMELPQKVIETGCTTAEHAERNAIAYAARYGVGTDGCTLYTTHGPCLECARTIINAGILRVVYETPYRLTAGVDLLTDAGVEVVHLPS